MAQEQLLKYQQEDSKLLKIEQEAAVSEERKNFIQTKSFLNKASEKQRQRLASMAGQRSVEKIEYYTHLYRELGAEQECRQMINHYGSESIKALNQSGIPADAINFFTNLAQASLTRTH